MVKLQSAEGDIFEVELEAACMSSFIKTMVEDGDTEAPDTSFVHCKRCGLEWKVPDPPNGRCTQCDSDVDDGSCQHGTDEVIPLCNVDTATLGKIIDYCRHHKGKQPELVSKPLRSRDLIDCGVGKWDSEFVDIEQDMLFKLIGAGNYLDIESLLDLCCAKVASMIKGRTADEVMQQFNISDFTPDEEAQVSAESSPPDRKPKQPKAAQRVSLGKAAEDIERAMDIPEGFKTIEIPASYRNLLQKFTKWQASSLVPKCSPQALDALTKVDPRMAMKASYRNFQEADKDGRGVLSLEEFLNFSRMEHEELFAVVGLELPFPEELSAEGFTCQQFEGQGGVTFTDIQIGNHMACRILKEQMAS